MSTTVELLQERGRESHNKSKQERDRSCVRTVVAAVRGERD